MTTIEAYGRIEGGKLTISNRKRFDEDIRDCKDCEVIIVVKKRGRRSNEQNRYYWGVVIQEIRLRFKVLGHRLTADEVHYYLKEKFSPYHFFDENGIILATIPGSTALMNKSEMTDYIEQIRMWAAQTLEIQIPDPNSPNELDL